MFIMKYREFDYKSARVESDSWSSSNTNEAFVNGAHWQFMKDDLLINVLVRSLKDECSCTGELGFNLEEILCNPCDTLFKLGVTL